MIISNRSKSKKNHLRKPADATSASCEAHKKTLEIVERAKEAAKIGRVKQELIEEWEETKSNATGESEVDCAARMAKVLKQCEVDIGYWGKGRGIARQTGDGIQLYKGVKVSLFVSQSVSHYHHLFQSKTSNHIVCRRGN